MFSSSAWGEGLVGYCEWDVIFGEEIDRFL
jgi:hypothetical protein